MLFRRKNREGSGAVDIQKLKREIRAELARAQGAVLPPEPEASASKVEPAEPQMRPHSVTASPLIQQAALGQMRTLANAGAQRDGDASPYGAFRDLIVRFESAAARIERQVDRVIELTERLAHNEPPAPLRSAPAPPPIAEPRFQPGGPPVQVTLAAVPNFPALMDIQHALSVLPVTANADVLELEQGEALLQVTLREPATLRQIMEGLSKPGTHSLLVEESRPEASRLRLRFIPQPATRSAVAGAPAET